MSIASFISLVSWISFIAMTWVMIYRYTEYGQGVSPALGLIIFLIMGLSANLASSIEKGGDTNES